MSKYLCIDDGPDEGTQVDCDEVFQELLKDCVGKNRLSLIILPVTLEWKKVVPDSSSSRSALGQFSSSTSGSSASSSSSQPNSPGYVPPLQSFGNPSSCLTERWSPLPMRDISLALDPVLKLLGEPSNKQPRNIFKLKQDAIKTAFKSITQHILLSVKYYRRCVAVHYAKSIFNFQVGLYKPIFAQSVNREVIGDGFDDFVLKVYNAISYGNSVDYGCVGYNPPSPVGETPEAQEDKRRPLLELAEDNSAEVNKLLRLTYASQRSEIIACKPLKKISTDFFPRWPHFKVAINLLQHAKVLMGKDILAIFSEQLNQKGKENFNVMEAIAAVEGTCNQTAKVKRADPARNF
ncbi:Alpha/beta hydrolase ucsC [Frankliniella fusca]|uniref:Alpha/beta hydrolase ucsC n=1 Tax=Frankliniella fusca TaxID=407009 RepID=A0AAE1HVA4_9NEOP|nr:Alpha/beta hydrolase ucsC [Frankliniella fusca]